MSAKNSRYSIKKLISKQEFSTFVIFVFMFLAIIILQKNFFEIGPLKRNINAFAPFILLAMGQAIVIISGGLDLSTGNALALIVCVMTSIMKADNPITGVYALLASIAVAILVGLINGIAVGYLRLPSVIATFATSFLWLGAALFITPEPGGEAVDWFNIFYNFGKIEGASEGLKSVGDIIPGSLILVLIGCLIWGITKRTKLGRHIYSVGSNNDCSYVSGIKTGAVQTKAFILNSFFVFLCALFYVAYNKSGSARFGASMTLRAISAAVIGGIALSGGRGNVFMVILGSLILSFVSKIIFLSDISVSYQTLVNGVVVIIAVSFSTVFSIFKERAEIKGANKNG